jgi:hypothetical protein
MNASGFGFSLAFALATGAAAHRDRPNVALRDFVPPALLHGGPDFLDSAIFAAERSILIVAALDEIRDTIAIVVSQQGGRHGFSTYRAVDRSSVDAADLDLPFSATQPLRLDFLTTLFVALHYAEKSQARLPVFLDRLSIGRLRVFFHRLVRHELARFGAFIDGTITAGTLVFCCGAPREVTENRNWHIL